MSSIRRAAGGDSREEMKWRAQARRAAPIIKARARELARPGQREFKVCFAFNDGLATLRLELEMIDRLSVVQIEKLVFESVVKAFQTRGESPTT